MRWEFASGLALVVVFGAACGLGVAGRGADLVDDADAASGADAVTPDAPLATDGETTPSDDAPSDAPFDSGLALDASDASSTAREKSITFDPSKVAATLSDFPVWIDLTDAEIAARAEPDGSDIFFVGPNGFSLPHEIQHWDSSGHLSAWVRIASLSNSSTAPTTIELRYGDKALAPAQAPATVFSAGFAAVWHLEDSLATPQIAEALGVAPGTGVNLLATQQVTAQLGGGISFTGGSDEITFTNPLTGSGDHTFSLWVSERATSDNDALIVIGNASCGQSRWFHAYYNAATVAAGFYCNDWANPGVDIVNDGFTLMHWVFDSTSQESRIYKNGALVAGPFNQTGTMIDTAGAGGYLGNAPAGWGTNMGAHATVDEVRIATVARTPEWIATEYNNQSSPSTFYAVGPESPVP